VRPGANRRRASSAQRGFALIALIALAALITAFLIASALNRTSADLSNDRERRNLDTLGKAKAALIAYAAGEQWQLSQNPPPAGYFQPGALPCPDKNDSGTSDCSGSTQASMIGRLPFSTMGIDDLRDASGERLWYALSHDFRKLQCTDLTTTPPSPSGCTIINSDTQGQLTVTGTTPATQVVAIVFAPGEAIQGQNRDPANPVAHNDPNNYLENFDLDNPANVHYTFTATGFPTDAANDRLLVITQADLMAVVEPVVAANMARDVKALLQDYFNKWGAYPFAVPFTSPPTAQSAYLGTSSPQTMMGLLPVTNTATFTWASASVASIAGSGTGRYTDPTKTISPNPAICSISSPPPPLTVTCGFTYPGTDGNDRSDIRLEVFLTNASMAFADTPAAATAAQNVMILNGNGNPTLDNGPPYGHWSSVGSVVPSLTFAAEAGGVALVYIGRLQNAPEMVNAATITFQLPAPPGYLPRLTNPRTTNPNIAWYLFNQWYRQTYYAMSSGVAPGGGGTCNPPPGAPTCLTVNNLSGTTNNKQAILILAGRALDGQSHPNATLSNYLEGQNATPADLIFENRAGVPTTINDRVVVVSP
jgi:hypothetical protein